MFDGFLLGCMVGVIVGGLIGGLIGGLASGLAGGLVGCFVGSNVIFDVGMAVISIDGLLLSVFVFSVGVVVRNSVDFLVGW